MLEILKFVFSGFWIFVGCMLFLTLLCDGITHVVNGIFDRPVQCPKLQNYECALKLIRDAKIPAWDRTDFTVFVQVKAKRALDGEEIVGSWPEENTDA